MYPCPCVCAWGRVWTWITSSSLHCLALCLSPLLPRPQRPATQTCSAESAVWTVQQEVCKTGSTSSHSVLFLLGASLLYNWQIVFQWTTLSFFNELHFLSWSSCQCCQPVYLVPIFSLESVSFPNDGYIGMHLQTHALHWIAKRQ